MTAIEKLWNDFTDRPTDFNKNSVDAHMYTDAYMCEQLYILLIATIYIMPRWSTVVTMKTKDCMFRSLCANYFIFPLFFYPPL